MAAFGHFCKAIFWHGGRRWLVLTLPGLMLGLAKLIGRSYPLPAWVSQSWAWALAVCIGLLLASYSAWHEQFTINRQLYGRPDVVLTCRYHSKEDPGFTFRDFEGFRFFLENAGQHVAVNISALNIRVPIPERVIKAQRETLETFGKGDSKLYTQWTVSFGVIPRLIKGSGEELLPFRIKGMGALEQQNIARVLGETADSDARSRLDLTLVFSNLGEPARTWHSHYELQYYLVRKNELVAHHIGFGEVPSGQGTCSGCQRARRSGSV